MRILQLIILLTLSPLLLAQDAIHKRLSTMDPSGQFSVSPTPIKGLYEVVQGGNVVYMSEDGKFMLHGSLVDIEGAKNLTEETLKTVRSDIFKNLSKNFITYGKKDAPHRVVVFTDVECGYCRRFHAKMDRMNDLGIAVDYVLTPILGPSSNEKALSVWCSSDRAKALTKAKSGGDVGSKTCDSPIDDNLVAAVGIGVRGTPAVYHPDGTKLGGYIEPEQLLQLLQNE